jgi:PAS domain-containing protein
MAPQRPLELILARNLISSLSTPAMLVNRPGDVVFYNDAAAMLLGHGFEETGTMSASDWVERHGPFDADGRPIPIDEQPLTRYLRSNRAGHARHRIRGAGDVDLNVEVSGVPIIGNDGFQGAIVFFWRTEEASR